MNEFFVRWVLIPGAIFSAYLVGQSLRKKMVQPTYKGNVQTLGRFDRGLLTFFKILTVIPLLLFLMGFIAKETEMMIVSAVMALAFMGITLFLKREYDMVYQENEEFFVLKAKKKEAQVFYKDIIDWQPGMNEILILDQTHRDQKYIKVNISMLRPEILLKKIAEKNSMVLFLIQTA